MSLIVRSILGYALGTCAQSRQMIRKWRNEIMRQALIKTKKLCYSSGMENRFLTITFCILASALPSFGQSFQYDAPRAGSEAWHPINRVTPPLVSFHSSENGWTSIIVRTSNDGVSFDVTTWQIFGARPPHFFDPSLRMGDKTGADYVCGDEGIPRQRPRPRNRPCAGTGRYRVFGRRY